MTLAVKVALNPYTTNQPTLSLSPFSFLTCMCTYLYYYLKSQLSLETTSTDEYIKEKTEESEDKEDISASNVDEKKDIKKNQKKGIHKLNMRDIRSQKKDDLQEVFFTIESLSLKTSLTLPNDKILDWSKLKPL